MTVDYVVGTALAAFFASLAAVLVSMLLDRRARRRESKSAILRAIQRQQERLWGYENAFQNSCLLGVDNAARNKGQFAPSKPPVSILTTEVRSVAHHFSADAQIALIETIRCIDEAEVANDDRSRLADWSRESDELRKIAERVASWNMRSPRLPPYAPSRS